MLVMIHMLIIPEHARWKFETLRFDKKKKKNRHLTILGKQKNKTSC